MSRIGLASFMVDGAELTGEMQQVIAAGCASDERKAHRERR
jgi:hypothetical protein